MSDARLDWEAACSAVDRARSILIVTHISPDGDAIGSLLGLTLALRERGKQVTPAVDGGVPEHLRFLPGADAVQPKVSQSRWDVMIALDASDEARIGDVGAVGLAQASLVINLDHHPTNTLFGAVHLVDPQAAAAAEIVYAWLERLGWAIPQTAATALLTGLVTDTIGFRTSNVTPRTLAVAQRLMEAGAPLHELMVRTLVSKPYSAIELWKHALATVQFSDGVISGVVSQEALKQAGLKDATDGGLVGLLSSVAEACMAAVFKELADGRVEVSLRCKPGFDVSQLALELGGGGHAQAAGATIDGPLADAQARVIPRLIAHLNGRCQHVRTVGE